MIRARAYETESVTSTVVFLAMASLVAAILLMAAPRPLGPIPTPLLPVMIVYFWTVARPGLMPAALAFAAGLALDLLTWTPLGFWALALLATSGVARIVRPYVTGADIWRRLAGISGAVAAVTLAALIGFGAGGRQIPTDWLQLLQLVLTVLTYPVLEAALFALARGAGLNRGRS